MPLPVNRPAGTLPKAPPSSTPPNGEPVGASGGAEAPQGFDSLASPVSGDATHGYQAVGGITSHELLTGRPDQFDHLQEKIVRVRDWLQRYLASNGMAEKVEEARLTPALREAVTLELDRALVQYMSKETVARGRDRDLIMSAVINEVIGLGPIEPLWSDRRITEVMVNGPREVFVEIAGRNVKATGVVFRDAAHLLDVCQRILTPLNRRIDQNSPLADGRLPDGSRVNIVHSALAPAGPYLTIRRFPDTTWTLRQYIETGSMTEEMAVELAFLVNHKCTTIVTGGTGSGKTSMLNALSSCIPRDERVITIEDALELRLHPQAHVLALEARPKPLGAEGKAVTIRDLIKNSLRMKPDRIVVGEVRDFTALDMLTAMNTGHEGSMTTLHSNGAEDVISRLGVLVATGGEIPEDKVGWLVADAVDLFVVPHRYEDGSRRLRGIYEMPRSQGRNINDLVPIPLWEWVHDDTTADGRYIGHYERRNELSADLVRRRRLDRFPPMTIEDVYAMSALPDAPSNR